MRDGVRSYEARNNLSKMKTWDMGFFYHSNEWKEIVWVCEVTQESYPDPSADDPKWLVVEVKPSYKFQNPVTLADIKSNSKLSNISLVRRSRLSVAPITKYEFDVIIDMSKSK